MILQIIILKLLPMNEPEVITFLKRKKQFINT